LLGFAKAWQPRPSLRNAVIMPRNPGRHRVAIEKEGYRTTTFDSDVLVRQVIPYQARCNVGG
jgi:hypothetical protein